MKNIIEIPSGEVIEIRDDQFELLRDERLVTYVVKYDAFCYYGFHKDDIFDLLDRTGLDGFDDFISNRFGKVK